MATPESELVQSSAAKTPPANSPATKASQSPFPGMDPFLERYWLSLHATFLVYVQKRLNRQLPPDLVTRVEEGAAIESDLGRVRTVYPDVRVVEDRVRSIVAPYSTAETAETMVAKPFEVTLLNEEPPPRHLEIIDAKDGNRVVSVIELLSPTNKLTAAGRAEYLNKQAEYIQSSVNLVEIDLLRCGEFVLAMPQQLWPVSQTGDYKICLRRVTKPAIAAGIGMPLRQRLPNIPIPLRPTDADAVLELQPIIDECYIDGRYHTIDYSRPLDPPFTEADAKWFGELLAKKLIP